MTAIEKKLFCAQDTINLGHFLGTHYGRNANLILLSGDLGAGKTTLANGFFTAILPQPTAILSPTYTYMNEYLTDRPCYHFDLYRIEHEHQLDELGLRDFLLNSHALRLVEWPEKVPDLYALADLVIELKRQENYTHAKIIMIKKHIA